MTTAAIMMVQVMLLGAEPDGVKAVSLLGAPVEAPVAAQSNAVLYFWIGMACIGGVITLATIAIRWWFAQAPADRAFWLLSRRFGLGRAGRRLVHRLAEAHGRAHPVALLLSQKAFVQATAAARQRGVALEAGHVDRVRGRIFSEG